MDLIKEMVGDRLIHLVVLEAATLSRMYNGLRTKHDTRISGGYSKPLQRDI
jgi:hypothetical protein